MNNRYIEEKDLQAVCPIVLLNHNNLNLEYAIEYEVRKTLKDWD